jgi:hypothetical protein
MKRTDLIRISIFSILILLILLTGCTSIPADSWLPEEDNPLPVEGSELTPIQYKLTASADHYLGTTGGLLGADDRSYSLDCSGALMAIYYRSGIDLEKTYAGYQGNGVKRLYSALRDNKLIHNAKIPAVGDLIFWDNTYDRNEDGEFNDYFTHTGMVVGVDTFGTITYAHHNYRLGIVYEKMNLLHPDDTKLNSPMRMRGSPSAPGGQYLASHLTRVFGRAWRLPKSYWR